MSPYIALSGKSLSKTGFMPGDKVEICSEYGFVIVKLLKVFENQLDCKREDFKNVAKDFKNFKG